MAKEKTVLVIGGAGFIGSHLCEALAEKEYKITVLDDLSTGRIENLGGIPHQFVNGSITNLSLMKKVCKGMDTVFHLAAINCVPQTIEDPIYANKINVDGTLNVLMAAKESKVKKVVYTSTSAVYGSSRNPVKCESTKTNPETPYAVGKLASEYYCRVFQEFYGLSTLCLRYSSVYGKRQRFDVGHAAVIPVFIDAIKHGKSPIIFGDGKQTRNFTYVDDTVAASMFLAEREVSGVFNVSCLQVVSVNELVELIAIILKKKVAPIHGEKRKGDIKHFSTDISKLQNLGFVPKYDIRAGLKETID